MSCQAVCGGSLDHANVHLTGLADAAALNRIMAEYFTEPYPARAKAVPILG